MVEFMWDFQRTLNSAELPEGESVICVRFANLSAYDTGWLISNEGVVDLCNDNPDKDIDG